MNRRPGGYPPRGRRPVQREARPTDPARRIAYDLLRAVQEREAYANLLLPTLLRERGVSGRDAAFATELAYGTLRGRGSYDAVLAACVDRGLDQVDPAVLDALRLGAHQLLAMRTPPHAAVSETVDLVRSLIGEGPARFANAVLRKVSARDLDGWTAQVAPAFETDPAGHLAVAHSHPVWVVNALRDALVAGTDNNSGGWDEVAQLLRANNARPQVTLVARPGRAEVAQLLDAGAEPGRWSPYAAVLPEGDPGGLALVRSGAAGVQDEGSQLVALALAQAEVAGDERHWLDLCAGPGGKAALLAGLAAQRSIALLAVEQAEHRAGLVAKTLAGAPGDHQVVCADGRGAPWRSGGFDRVLVDAPCTGLGALRRRPESRWRRTPADVPALAGLQRELLRSGLDAARPGGLVAYVTCSPHLAETRMVVEDVLAERAGAVQPVDVGALLAVPDTGPGPYAQLWPHRHGTDAMFLALLRRVR